MLKIPLHFFHYFIEPILKIWIFPPLFFFLLSTFHLDLDQLIYLHLREFRMCFIIFSLLFPCLFILFDKISSSKYLSLILFKGLFKEFLFCLLYFLFTKLIYLELGELWVQSVLPNISF